MRFKAFTQGRTRTLPGLSLFRLAGRGIKNERCASLRQRKSTEGKFVIGPGIKLIHNVNLQHKSAMQIRVEINKHPLPVLNHNAHVKSIDCKVKYSVEARFRAFRMLALQILDNLKIRSLI